MNARALAIVPRTSPESIEFAVLEQEECLPSGPAQFEGLAARAVVAVEVEERFGDERREREQRRRWESRPQTMTPDTDECWDSLLEEKNKIPLYTLSS